ncbi:MAG: universal stress protein [Proteobacteria bacterium]|jgi:universal stress protein A|nr:universal stress protein [Pseudomonadota bacterium]
MAYKKILLALDFHSDNDKIIARAKEVVEDNDAELNLVHVNEPLGMAYSVDGMAWSEQVVMLETSLRNESRTKMAQISTELGVPSDRCFVGEGKAAAEIKKVAEQHDIDLIIMGTHGQSGLQLLLGSTANGVLHGAPCDVLTVRVGKD